MQSIIFAQSTVVLSILTSPERIPRQGWFQNCSIFSRPPFARGEQTSETNLAARGVPQVIGVGKSKTVITSKRSIA